MDINGVSAGRPVGSTESHLLTLLTLSCRDEKIPDILTFFSLRRLSLQWKGLSNPECGCALGILVSDMRNWFFLMDPIAHHTI